MKWGVICLFLVGVAGCSQESMQTAGGSYSSPAGASAPAAQPDPTPSRGSVSGTYVAGGQETLTGKLFLEALRITQSGPDQFTGSMETTELDSAGKETSSSSNVTGAFDTTGHVTISMDELIGHTNRTGSLQPGSITLSWMQEGRLMTETFLLKSDQQYGQMLNALQQASMQLVAQRRTKELAADANAQAQALTVRVEHDVQVFQQWSMAPLEQEQAHAMRVAQAHLKRVELLMQGSAVDRSQAQVEVDQFEVDHNQLRMNLNNLSRQIEEARTKLAQLDAELAASPCMVAGDQLAPNAPPACSGLISFMPQYREGRKHFDAVEAQMTGMDQQTDRDFVAVLHEAQQAAGMTPTSQ